MTTKSKDTIIDKPISILLSFYAMMLPFEEALASTFGSVLRIIAIVIMVYIFVRYFNERFDLMLTKDLLPWFIYISISVLWASSFEWWWYFGKIYYNQFIFLIIVSIVPAIKIDLKIVRHGFVAGAIIATTILLLFAKNSFLTDDGRRTIIIFGNTLDPNILAALISIGVFCLFIDFFEHDDKKINKLPILVLVYIFIGVLLTGSRGIVIAIVTSFFTGTFLQLKSSRKKGMKILFASIIVLAIAFSFIPEQLLQSRFSVQNILGLDEVDSGSHNRYTIWSHTSSLFFASPLIGHGSGNFIETLSTVYKPSASHNIFILLLIEGGILGFSLFIAAVFALLKQLYRQKLYSYVTLYLFVIFTGMSLDAIAYKYFWLVWLFATIKVRQCKKRGEQQ